VGKCAYYSSIILTKIESLLCLELCWHNLPGPTQVLVEAACTKTSFRKQREKEQELEPKKIHKQCMWIHDQGQDIATCKE